MFQFESLISNLRIRFSLFPILRFRLLSAWIFCKGVRVLLNARVCDVSHKHQDEPSCGFWNAVADECNRNAVNIESLVVPTPSSEIVNPPFVAETLFISETPSINETSSFAKMLSTAETPPVAETLPTAATPLAAKSAAISKVESASIFESVHPLYRRHHAVSCRS